MSRRSRLAAASSMLAILTLGTLAGCSSGGGSASAMKCGIGHTAAGVPVTIDLVHGQVACHVAMSVEQAYSREVASGKVSGNGGGAPVKIQGWVCQGFNTPQVLATGHASACKKDGQEILATLPSPPSPAVTPS